LVCAQQLGISEQRAADFSAQRGPEAAINAQRRNAITSAICGVWRQDDGSQKKTDVLVLMFYCDYCTSHSVVVRNDYLPSVIPETASN